MDDCNSHGASNANECRSLGEALSYDQQELSRILEGFQNDPTGLGCWDLGSDGVLRSLTADRDVVDAIGLPTRMIKAFLDRLPFRQDQEDRLRGADGTRIPREEWFNPDKSKLPLPMSEEEKERAKRLLERNKEHISQIQERRRRGELQPCRPIIRSNHHLGAKGDEPDLTRHARLPTSLTQ